jgi:uncharacterized protein (TIGR03382 family)
MGLAALFAVIATGLAVIAVSAFDAGRYPVAIGAAALAAWMVTLAYGVVRRRRRVR